MATPSPLTYLQMSGLTTAICPGTRPSAKTPMTAWSICRTQQTSSPSLTRISTTTYVSLGSHILPTPPQTAFSHLADTYLKSKGTLVGHSDKNAAEDTGHLRVTYANNHFYKVASRGPLLRFGTAHIFNNYYNEQDTGVNTRMGAQALVQSTVFENSGKKMVYTESSAKDGYAVVIDTIFGGQSANTAPLGTLSASSFPYSYSLLGSANVKASVLANAGQKLAF